MGNVAIHTKGLSKMYQIGGNKPATFRERLYDFFSSGREESKEFWALNDINLEIKKGEALGIIGKNGAGKSTLLKVLSQITHPTEGEIEIHGRIASLLEVGTGFHPELTGKENIFLNGTILGMRRKEVKNRLDEIIDFSGVEKFINTPVKHYSSGMYVRLAFAVAAHLEPEILIIDEVLAVGDAEFQKKCLGRMDDVAHSGKTVLFVSHNMSAVKNLCSQGIVLDKGKITFNGDIGEAIATYNTLNTAGQREFDLRNADRNRGAQMVLVSKAVLNSEAYYPDSFFEINIELEQIKKEIKVDHVQLAIFISDSMQNTVYQLSTLFFEDERIAFDEGKTYSFLVDKLNLSAGMYSVGIWLQGNGFEQDYVEGVVGFEVHEGNIYGKGSPKIVSQIQKEFEFKMH